MTLTTLNLDCCLTTSSHKNGKSIYFIIWLVLTSSLVKRAEAWDSDELELFDLVEEVNTNFYELLGISQESDNKEIKKAFRRLSLVLHPDKNDAPDADVKFRQLVAVYEVLLDEKKRSHYHLVLENGLPDWKQAVYYFRRVRKMGLMEMAVILFLILTVGQYAVLWAAYVEKKYTAEQFVTSKMKKIQKKLKKSKNEGADDVQEIFFDLPKPSVFDLLPFQIWRGLWLCITGAPQFYQILKALLAERRRQQEEEEISDESSQEDEGEEKKERRPRRRKAFLPPELLPEDEDGGGDGSEIGGSPKITKPAPAPQKVLTGGLWTDDDFTELARLVKKYPGGTSKRWEKIADAMNRSVPEVTHMANKIKEENYKPAQITTTEDVDLKPSKLKTKGGKLLRGTQEPTVENGNIEGESPEQPSNTSQVAPDVWSQTQQKALETALAKFPKGTSERWVKIAKSVPDKNMEECIVRYKQLVELIKKKKAMESNPESEPAL